MRSKHLILIASFLIFPISKTMAQDSVHTDTIGLSLDQCLEIALSSNPTVKVADMEIKRVDYSKKEVLGQLFPTISFGGTYNRTLAKQVAYFNMPGTDTSGDESSTTRTGIKMGLDNSFNMGFSAAIPLVAPQLWKTLKLSDSQILQNIEAARSSRISLVNQVQNAFYALLLSYESYAVIKDDYETAIFNAKIYKGKFDVGTASEYEVLRTSVRVKNLEPELLQAEIAIKQAQLQLKVLMGMEVSVPIIPTAKLTDYEKTMYDHTLNIDKSLLDNSDLKSLDLKTDYLKKALDVQKMAWYPTLSFSANYSWVSSSDGSPFKNFRWDPYSVAGLTLSFSIFEGGQRYNKIKQAEISVREMSYQRENLIKSLNMQIDLQVDNIKKNVKQIASNGEGVAQAKKAFDIMEKSFQIGAATYLDLRDSELALTTSKLTYYQSIYNYLVATSDLQLILGNANIGNYPKSGNEIKY